ncbi:MAG: hypothetical protein R3B71_01115 [Candidatus Gracilibacteria bacterium]
MKNFKKYSPFVYFFGGMEGGGEKAPESTDEAPKKETEVTPDDAKEEAKNMTGGALAGLEKAEELSEGISDMEAVKLYDEKIDPVREIIDFFKAKEKNIEGKNRQRLERAFVAAGGEEGQSTKPSNILNDGFPKNKPNTIGLAWIYENLNKADSSNHIAALQKLSKKPGFWNTKFKPSLEKTFQMAQAAKNAYEQS